MKALIWKAHGGAGTAYVAVLEKDASPAMRQSVDWRTVRALPGCAQPADPSAEPRRLVADAVRIGVLREHGSFGTAFGPLGWAADEGTPTEVDLELS